MRKYSQDARRYIDDSHWRKRASVRILTARLSHIFPYDRTCNHAAKFEELAASSYAYAYHGTS
eukprot:9287454-Pyramimonas_sp.AAC.2